MRRMLTYAANAGSRSMGMRNWLIAGSIAGLMVAGLGAATVAQAADSARPVHNYEVTPFAG